METIFKNKEELSRLEILMQLGIGIILLIVVYILFPFRHPSQEINLLTFIFFSFIMTILWFVNALKQKVIIQIDINKENNNLILTVQKHFNRLERIEFNADSIKFNVRIKPDRLLPQNKILTITDYKNEIFISIRETGIGTENFEIITERIKKHYTQQRL